MKTIDVRIAWDKPDEQHWLNADNIKTALEAHCCNTNFTVTELSPQQDGDWRNELANELENSLDEIIHEVSPAERYRIADIIRNWKPAAPVAAPNCNLCKPPIDKENCAACNGIPAPVAPAELNCLDCARMLDCGHFGYPEDEECFVQPAAPVTPAVESNQLKPAIVRRIWVCPGCQTTNTESDILCKQCNTARQPVPCQECEKLRAENTDLKSKLGFTYCAYCGKKFPIDAPDATDAISEHVAACEKHPMRKMEAENEKLQKENEKLRAENAELKWKIAELKQNNEQVDYIEEGDIVTVHLNDGDMIRYAKVLWSPCATGDSWRFKCDGGKIVYVQTFQLIELVNKGEG